LSEEGEGDLERQNALALVPETDQTRPGSCL
jgi:hypothetical protein